MVRKERKLNNILIFSSSNFKSNNFISTLTNIIYDTTNTLFIIMGVITCSIIFSKIFLNIIATLIPISALANGISYSNMGIASIIMFGISIMVNSIIQDYIISIIIQIISSVCVYIISLICLSYFYGVILYLATVIIGKSSFGYGELIRSLNISLSGGYWFVKIYIILYKFCCIIYII